jgi:methyl-accepting chemotaxis protein
LRVIEMVAVFLISIVTLSLFIRFNVVKPLRVMLASLGEGSAQIESAATQVSSGAEHLAEGTAKEAAAIEGTSSTVEELTSTTQRNAQHANQTERLTRETKTTVEEAGRAMRSLFDSIQEIKTSSAATSKIIKTIDEISFQTNILALNAAVEAARAGEHGAGFAVVADEVRTLARRAADAAKDTSQLIENTNRQISQAAGLVEATRTGFDQVMTRVEKTNSYVSEIASASTEQARGLEQLNSNLTEIDQVVQDTVANAEESAAAAQEMCAQTTQMNEVIRDLRLLIGIKDGLIQSSHPENTNDDGGNAAEVSLDDSEPLAETSAPVADER